MKFILWAAVTAVIVSSCKLGAENLNKGMHFYSQGDFVNAKSELLKAENSSKGYYSKQQYYTILGNICKELNQLDEAIDYHHKALKIEPNFIDALVNLGAVHRLKGDFDKALKCYEKANTINPDDAELHASMGSLYIYKNQPKLAASHLEKSIELNFRLAIAHSNYSIVLAMLGEYQRAEEELKIAEALGYRNGNAVRNRLKVIASQPEEIVGLPN